MISGATVGLPRLNSPRSDRRGEIAQGSKRKRKPKQSRALTHARKGTLALSPHSSSHSQISIGFSVEFRSVFRAPYRKFKILAIPVVLAHGKSYKHGFPTKCDGHKLCAKSRSEWSFDTFFVHRLGNSKYWPFPTY
ncbi:hypothetical protein B296_00056576 [Ensete ventricosum]|uniref:Uncharacterized protein n=1 Tax=Ensete ventricosum TaxID=4639 RepID=A0A426WZ28_ENSVE|nr:hypothetical protein B296_00056576 [Ensete ventricosum]